MSLRVTFDRPRWLRENRISGERLNIINLSTSFPRRLVHLPRDDWLLFPYRTALCARGYPFDVPRGAALGGIQNVSRRKWRIDRLKEREREGDPGGREPREFLVYIPAIRNARLTGFPPPLASSHRVCIYVHVCVRAPSKGREACRDCTAKTCVGYITRWFSRRCRHTLPPSKFRCCDNNERLSEATGKPTFAMRVREFHLRWDDSQRKTATEIPGESFADPCQNRSDRLYRIIRRGERRSALSGCNRASKRTRLRVNRVSHHAALTTIAERTKIISSRISPRIKVAHTLWLEL